MSPSQPSPPADRRHEVGLSFDPAAGLLRIGHHERTLAPGSSNRDVLVAYVELTARNRGDRVANVVEVRHADVEALAQALDLDAADLGQEIEAVLGATRAEALKVVTRLRESRVIGGIAKAATSAAVAGMLVTGCSGATSEPARATTTTAAPTAATSAAPSASSTTVTADQPVVDGPLTVDEDGVGLIPPISVDADGTGLIPPASVDAPGGS